MSVNIHLVARRISDNSVVLDITADRWQSAEIWRLLDIDVAVYPDSTGSVFRDMPGHLAVNALEGMHRGLQDCAPISVLMMVLCNAQEPLSASIIWS